ncbi:hypothetical protein [Planococcus halotolerans]|uniref:Uncharacterized protein n=1 Tax=Planococcus halotolerans TaxID=2233542 RepID=A0A365L2B0_9BACL|nr:hypothetical protein [Planococcus halotolerans]QHJ70908.1 hypothetical protein DNR44_009935 [Planococcus halotolerans]RAZ79335.1 hypothetical protein DP120_06910 [Planococcus halotolerans]
MYKENKNFAERALKQLLIGSQLDGFRFGIGPGAVRVCFSHYSEQDPDVLWLTIEVRKIATIINKERLTTISKETVEELDDEESFQLLLRYRREKVKDVWLGDESPHLYISFESGKVLYVNGHDKNYECWQLGDMHGYGDGDWLIVAVPSNEIATWSPEEFK